MTDIQRFTSLARLLVGDWLWRQNPWTVGLTSGPRLRQTNWYGWMLPIRQVLTCWPREGEEADFGTVRSIGRYGLKADLQRCSALN